MINLSTFLSELQENMNIIYESNTLISVYKNCLIPYMNGTVYSVGLITQKVMNLELRLKLHKVKVTLTCFFLH